MSKKKSKPSISNLEEAVQISLGLGNKYSVRVTGEIKVEITLDLDVCTEVEATCESAAVKKIAQIPDRQLVNLFVARIQRKGWIWSSFKPKGWKNATSILDIYGLGDDEDVRKNIYDNLGPAILKKGIKILRGSFTASKIGK